MLKDANKILTYLTYIGEEKCVKKSLTNFFLQKLQTRKQKCKRKQPHKRKKESKQSINKTINNIIIQNVSININNKLDKNTHYSGNMNNKYKQKV